MCAGECGEGLEGGLFSCGGCGGEAAQGVDGRMSPRSVYCGDSATVGALRYHEPLPACACATCGVVLGVDCVNVRVIHMSIKV